MSSWPEDWMTWRVVAAFLLKPENNDDLITTTTKFDNQPHFSFTPPLCPREVITAHLSRQELLMYKSDKIQWNCVWRLISYLAYWVVLTLSVLESLEVSSVSTKSVGASQVARAVSMSPALLGFTEIIRTLQIVFKVAKTLETTKVAGRNLPFIYFIFLLMWI